MLAARGNIALNSVEKVWSQVTQLIPLRVIEPFSPMVPFTAQPLSVFTSKQERLQDAAQEQKQGHVTKYGAVSWLVTGLILGAIDVATNNAIEVAPTDHEAKRDSTFVYAYDLLACSGNK